MSLIEGTRSERLVSHAIRSLEVALDNGAAVNHTEHPRPVRLRRGESVRFG